MWRYITIVIGCCWASIFPNLWGGFPPQLQPRSILRMRNFQRVNAMVEQAKAAKVRKQIRAISPNIWVNFITTSLRPHWNDS